MISIRSSFLLSLVLLALAAVVLADVPAFAVEAPAPSAAVAALSDACPQPEGGEADLAGGLSGLLAPAFALEDDAGSLQARPPFFRTCRCSCGAPCTTDADCGGGRCTSGITCCVAPGPTVELAPEDAAPAAAETEKS
ncbi:MAG: hypothetical protein KDD47_08095 [Acidobacteria bacterium]|nr:hypothetical protein [Acidobacteriota bacterium]